MSTAAASSTRYLSAEQVASFWEHGYLRMEQVFTPEKMDELDVEMDRLMVEWANNAPGWSGDWRKVYMDEETEKQSKLIAMHDLWYYSAAWTRAVLNRNLVTAMSDLLGPDVELHHATMHVKPPETGHPFPMHQDNAFYAHKTDRFVDTLVHPRRHQRRQWRDPLSRRVTQAGAAGSHPAHGERREVHAAPAHRRVAPGRHRGGAGAARRRGVLQPVPGARLLPESHPAGTAPGADRLP